MHWSRAERLHQWKSAVEYIGASTLEAVNEVIDEQQLQLGQIISQPQQLLRPPSQPSSLKHPQSEELPDEVRLSTSSNATDIDADDNPRQSSGSDSIELAIAGAADRDKGKRTSWFKWRR
jgi:hypothetical protein